MTDFHDHDMVANAAFTIKDETVFTNAVTVDDLAIDMATDYLKEVEVCGKSIFAMATPNVDFKVSGSSLRCFVSLDLVFSRSFIRFCFAFVAARCLSMCFDDCGVVSNFFAQFICLL